MKAFVGIVLVFASFFQIDVMYTGQPLWLLWGNSEYIRYDSEAHVWMNHNPEIETLFRVLDLYDRVQKQRRKRSKSHSTLVAGFPRIRWRTFRLR